tara:strand:- start:22848 stop:23216 length:369 start_codon:yes stop_codon:yes gene_type:complete
MVLKSKGLGDDIKKIADKTGISTLVEKIFGDDCGCDERREKLNKLFPNFKNIRPFTTDEKKVYESLIPEIHKKKHISPNEKKYLNVLYKAVFNSEAQWSNCGKCNIKTLENLRRVYEKSCEE